MLRYITSLLIVAFAAPTVAGELSYTYIQGGYQRVELDDISGIEVDGDGYAIGGSIEVGENFHLFADYAATDFDFGVDFDQYSLGVGYHASITNNLDAVFEVSYVRAEAEVIGFSVDDDGYGASIGVRSMLGERFELGGSVNYVDLGSGSDDTSLDGTARYYLTPAFAVGISAGVADDETTYGAALQWYFGK